MLNMTYPLKTTCLVLFFDKHSITDWVIYQECICYHMKHRILNLSTFHTIKFDNTEINYITILKFS